MSLVLMSDIYYQESTDADWIRWSFTDGCPTGREYSIYLQENVVPLLSNITDYLNSCITCIYEKHINPVAIKFNLTNIETKEITHVLIS